MLALVPIPAGVVTVIFPVVAAAGTFAEIWVEELTVNVAATPLNLTAVAPPKSRPRMFTLLPTPPLEGEKLVIVGAGTTVKVFGLVALPAAFVTVIGPLGAPAGTVVVSWVRDVTT